MSTQTRRCRATAGAGKTDLLVYERPFGMRTLRFAWGGGEYISVSAPPGAVMEVINVWDHVQGRATIPATLTELRWRAERWIAEYPPDQLAADALYW